MCARWAIAMRCQWEPIAAVSLFCAALLCVVLPGWITVGQWGCRGGHRYGVDCLSWLLGVGAGACFALAYRVPPLPTGYPVIRDAVAMRCSSRRWHRCGPIAGADLVHGVVLVRCVVMKWL